MEREREKSWSGKSKLEKESEKRGRKLIIMTESMVFNFIVPS